MNTTVPGAPASQIRRFLFEALDIRGAVVQLTDVWQALQAGREMAPAVARVLGELTATTVVIAGNLKQPGRLTVQLHGDGDAAHPLRLAVVDCSHDLNVRALARLNEAADARFATPSADAVDLAALIGSGRLQLALDAPSMREPYISLVPLAGDSIASNFEHYLAQSEQQPAALFLAASADAAAALFLQRLPGADQRDADGWTRVTTLAQTVKDEELLTLSPLQLLTRLFSEEDLRLFDPRVVRHDWPEDRAKIGAMLLSLGEAEVRRILAEHGEVRVQDDLSNHDYHFSAADIDALFAAPPSA